MSYTRTIRLLLNVGLLLLLLLPTFACNNKSWDLDFQFHKDDQPISRADLVGIKLSLYDPTNRANDTAKGWNVDITPGTTGALDSLPCPSDLRSDPWTGLSLSPSEITELSPFLQALGRGADNEEVITYTGRLPYYLACQWSNPSFYMVRPGQFSEWFKDAKANEDFERIGHQLTRMSDGRYLITGGARNLSINSDGSIGLSDPVNSVLLYHPAYNTLMPILGLTINRAFHSASWSEGKVLLSGGFRADSDDKALKESQLLFLVPKGKANTNTEAQSYAKSQNAQIQAEGNWQCAQLPRSDKDKAEGNEFLCQLQLTAGTTHAFAFTKDFRIPLGTDNKKSVTLRIGGIRQLVPSPDNPPTSGESLFHQATYLESSKSILATGGFYYNQRNKRFESTNFLYSVTPCLEATCGNLVQQDPPEAKLQVRRAGHLAIPLRTSGSQEAVLLVGGITGAFGNGASLRNAQMVPSMELLRKEDNTWKSETIEPITPSFDLNLLGRRAFASSTNIPTTDLNSGLCPKQDNNPPHSLILITGGFDSLQPTTPTRNLLLCVGLTTDNKVVITDATPQTNPPPRFPQVGFGLLSSMKLLETGQVGFIGGADASFAGNRLKFTAKAQAYLYQPPLSSTSSTKSNLIQCDTNGKGPLCLEKQESPFSRVDHPQETITKVVATNKNWTFRVGTFRHTMQACVTSNKEPINLSPTSPGDPSIFVIRYNEKGECAGAIALGGKGTDDVSDGAIATNNTLVLVGTGTDHDKYTGAKKPRAVPSLPDTLPICDPKQKECPFPTIIRIQPAAFEKGNQAKEGIELSAFQPEIKVTSEAQDEPPAPTYVAGATKLSMPDKDNPGFLFISIRFQDAISPDQPGHALFSLAGEKSEYLFGIKEHLPDTQSPQDLFYGTIRDFHLFRPFQSDGFFLAGLELKGVRLGTGAYLRFPSPRMALLLRQKNATGTQNLLLLEGVKQSDLTLSTTVRQGGSTLASLFVSGERVVLTGAIDGPPSLLLARSTDETPSSPIFHELSAKAEKTGLVLLLSDLEEGLKQDSSTGLAEWFGKQQTVWFQSASETGGGHFVPQNVGLDQQGNKVFMTARYKGEWRMNTDLASSDGVALPKMDGDSQILLSLTPSDLKTHTLLESGASAKDNTQPMLMTMLDNQPIVIGRWQQKSTLFGEKTCTVDRAGQLQDFIVLIGREPGCLP